MGFVLGVITGAVGVLTIIGLHRLISYDRYREGYYDGLFLHDVTIREKEDKNK